MANHIPVYIGPGAVDRLVDFCGHHGLDHLALVADANTYAAAGRAAEEALSTGGFDVLTVLVQGDDIIADACYVFQTMLALDHTPRTFIAAGSGTLTDITRFISHRSGADFLSLPTAASVDGYTSIGAPMVIEGVKTTVNCHGPLAVFADIEVLSAAPRPLTAAGFGDMLAKYTSTADWELGHLIHGDAYDPAISGRMRRAAQDCTDLAGPIAAGSEDGVHALMDGLIESGFCMLDFGQTMPASGWEHHFSHFIEMKLLQEGRHSILHGAKVGLGVLASAQCYATVRKMGRAEAAERLAERDLPDPGSETAEIRAAYGPIAESVIEGQQSWLEMSGAEFDVLKARIVEAWDEIQRIAQIVPPEAELRHWIGRAGGPVTGPEAGLSGEEVALAISVARHLKNRMTIGRLAWLLGIA